MEKILVTGAFGNVGCSTVQAVLDAGYGVMAFDRDTRGNRLLARKLLTSHRPGASPAVEVFWGDIRDSEAVQTAAGSCVAVIHLAAVIPPLADRHPDLAASVNVGGTRTVIAVCESLGLPIIHASSIALYGDRLANPHICVDDPVQPAPGDLYGFQKAEAESLVRKASCPWTILRLSYVVSRRKLAIDPLMFRMPLSTSIEVVHTEDAGRAFAHVLGVEACRGKTYNIGGGERCRTSYRDYLLSMFRLFGFRRRLVLPPKAFASQGYHCGWLDSELAEQALCFQRKTLADYYVEVAEEARRLALLVSFVPGLAFRLLMRRSPYLKTR